MPFSADKLLACIEPSQQEFEAAFVSAAAPRRVPDYEYIGDASRSTARTPQVS
jgi:hypothetical protein